MSFPVLIRRFAVVASVAVWASVLPVIDLPDKAGVVHRALDLRAPGVIRATVGFGLIGVTWPAGAADPSEVHVRTSLDGKRWSRWTELDADEEDGPDRGTEGPGVRSTTPLWVGEARFADVRVTGRLPRGARVHLIDPGPDPASPPASALASPGKPGMISRAAWGADESIRRCCPRYAEPLKLAIVHHTATGNSYSAQDSARIVRSIYTYHVKSNGWDDIGYNFLVDRYGQIFEGRSGGVGRAVIGAHAQGFNTGSSGVAVIGTFSSARPPAAAWDSLKKITAWRLDRAYINPLGSTTMTSGGSSSWPAGQKVTLQNVSAHRDVGNTACPGQPFYDALGSLRGEVASYGDPKVYTPKLSRPIITPNDDGVADRVDLTAGFSSLVSWKVEVTDPSGKVWKTKTGSGTAASVPWTGRNSSGRAPHDRYRLRITASNSRGSVRAVTLSVKLWRYPNGTLFHAPGWKGVLEGQRLRHFLTSRALTSRYRSAEAIAVPSELLRVYPVGRDLGFRDGSVVRADGKLWIISDGKRRSVSQATLDALRYSRSAVIDTSAKYLSPHATGTTVTVSGGYPNGTALKSSDLREGVIRGGQTRPFLTRNIRVTHGIRDVDLAGPADAEMAQATGNAAVGFREGTLVRPTSSAAVYVIADGYRRHIRSGHRLAAMGYDRDNIRSVTDAELSLHPEGQPL